MSTQNEASTNCGRGLQCSPLFITGALAGIVGAGIAALWFPFLREVRAVSHLNGQPEASIFVNHRDWGRWSFLPDHPLSKYVRRLAPPQYTTHTLHIGPRFPCEEFGHVAEIERFSEIHAKGCPLTGEDLRALRGLRSVFTLDLEGTRVDDAGLTHIRHLVIDKLSLAYTSVSDIGLVQLTTNTALVGELSCLDVRGTRIRGSGLAGFKGSRLHEVLLADSKFEDTGLPYLEGLENLRELHLSGTGVTDVGMGGFIPPSSLHSIQLDRTSVTGEGLQRLFSKVPPDRFNDISLANTSLASEDARRMKCDPTYLSLAGTKVDDGVVPWLVSRTRLRNLDLSHTAITDAGLDALGAHPDLNYVGIEGCALSEAAKRRFIAKRTRYDPNSTTDPPALAQPLSEAGIAYRMTERWERYEHSGWLDRSP
jgi:hypothetical protein